MTYWVNKKSVGKMPKPGCGTHEVRIRQNPRIFCFKQHAAGYCNKWRCRDARVVYARTRRVCVLTSPQGRRTARENGCDGHASTVGTVCCSLHLVRNPHHLSNAYQICWGATPFLTEGLGVGARGLAAAGQGVGRDRRWSLFSSQKRYRRLTLHPPHGGGREGAGRRGRGGGGWG